MKPTAGHQSIARYIVIKRARLLLSAPQQQQEHWWRNKKEKGHEQRIPWCSSGWYPSYSQRNKAGNSRAEGSGKEIDDSRAVRQERIRLLSLRDFIHKPVTCWTQHSFDWKRSSLLPLPQIVDRSSIKYWSSLMDCWSPDTTTFHSKWARPRSTTRTAKRVSKDETLILLRHLGQQTWSESPTTTPPPDHGQSN